MSDSVSGKRPWLAAALAVIATGLGHLYLRRWKRALGWLAAFFGTAALFVDPAALEALATGGDVDPAAIAPVLFVGALSVVDAYLLARVQSIGNAEAIEAAGGQGFDALEGTPSCPNCGEELDPEVDFCPWCAADLNGDAGRG